MCLHSPEYRSWGSFQAIPLASLWGWPGCLWSVCWDNHQAHLSVFLSACVSVHWRWRICIIARASSKTQTSPRKTVSSSLKFSSSFTQPMQELINSSHLKFGQWSWGLLIIIPCWKCHYKLKTDDTTQTPPCVSHLASCHSITITVDGPAPSQSCQKKCQTWPCGSGGGGVGVWWGKGGEGGASLPREQDIKWMTSSFQQE